GRDGGLRADGREIPSAGGAEHRGGTGRTTEERMMSEQITQQTDDGTPERTDADDAQAALRREAAGYRTRLRDVEAERDTLRATVAAIQRGEVERIAGTTADG